MMKKTEVYTLDQPSIYLIGEDSLSVACGNILLQKGFCIKAVVSESEVVQSWANNQDLPYFYSLDDIALSPGSFDYLLSVVNSRLLSKAWINAPKRCAINYHNGLLPQYAGVHATSWALIHGEAYQGVTWHSLSEQVDAGDILKQSAFLIEPTDTALSLNLKAHKVAIELFKVLVDELSRDKLSFSPQDLEKRTYYAFKDKPPDGGVIRWGYTADQIARYHRALDFGGMINRLGVPSFLLDGHVLVPRKLVVLDHRSESLPGTLLGCDAHLQVATASQDIALSDITTLSGEPRSVSQLVEQFGLLPGYRLPEPESDFLKILRRRQSQSASYERSWVHHLLKAQQFDLSKRLCFQTVQKAQVLSSSDWSCQHWVCQDYIKAEQVGQLLTAVCVYAYRISNSQAFSVAFSSTELKESVKPFDAFFSAYVPLTLDFDPQSHFSAAADILRKQLDALCRRSPLEHSVWTRHPELKSCGGLPVIVIDQVDTLEHYCPPDWSTLVVGVQADGNALSLWFNRKRAAYGKEAFEHLPSRLACLLMAVQKDPKQAICRLPLLSEAEQQALFKMQKASCIEAKEAEIGCEAEDFIEVFEKQVEKTPDAPAVAHGRRVLSYRELNQRANQLARMIRGHWEARSTERTSQQTQEHVVGLCMSRCLNLLVGVLGILKAGAAYLPIDPRYPKRQVAHILQNANPAMLLTQSDLVDQLSGFGIKIALLDQVPRALVGSTQDNLPKTWRVSDLAYVIYTSGTTGLPKGVAGSHKALMNLNKGLLPIYAKLPKALSVSLNGPLSFDTSLKQILQILNGHCLHILPESCRLDAKACVDYLREFGIQVFDCTPSQFKLLVQAELLEQCQDLLCILLGGEPIPMDVWRRCQKISGKHFYNMYGPTECTGDSLFCELGANTVDFPVIGRPICHTDVYLLDRFLNPMPNGVPGELYIGGRSLALGYYNHPKATHRSFVPSPFGDRKAGECSRLYKTGDWVCRLGDGNRVWLGRLDHQIKVRGIRVEVEAIEQVLSRHPSVLEAAVTLDKAKDRLVAHIVTKKAYAPIFRGEQRYVLPNGLAVSQLNKNETDFLYHDLFENNAYFKHGITVQPGERVFDVGANIGLFTLLVHMQAQGVRVHAFEPNPFVFKKLRNNCLLYDVDVQLHNTGLSRQATSTEFHFYPAFSILSGLYTDMREDQEVVRSYLKRQGQFDQTDDDLLEALLDEKFRQQTFKVRLSTLSEIIRQQDVKVVHLLKINVERSEWDVLSGLSEEDWPKIRQVVVEVHNDGTCQHLDRIVRLLETKGFTVTVEKDWSLEAACETNYYLYAIHSAYKRPSKPFKVARPACIKPLLSTKMLRQFASDKLRQAVIPTHFNFLEALPLSEHGKIDRKRLSALPIQAVGKPEDEHYVLPSSSAEKQLASIWCQKLGLKSVSIHDNFFDLGGHSLLATEVILVIRDQFKQDLSVHQFFSRPTIAELAEVLIRKGAEGSTDTSADQLIKDSVLPTDMNTLSIDRVNQPIENLLITGVTGFLGAQIVRALAQFPVKKLYCLVRASGGQSARARIKRTLETHLGAGWRQLSIICLEGDLSQPKLGLSDSLFQKLASEVHAIFHVAAYVNHVRGYADLRKPNVLGTMNLLELAAQDVLKPIYYLSTLSAVVEKGGCKETWVRSTHCFLTDGYNQTKWASERLLAQAHDQGMPIKIFRSGWIIADRRMSHQLAENNHLYRLVKACIQLGYAPDWSSPMNLLPVDFVSQLVTSIALEGEALPHHVFNLVNPNRVYWHDLINWVNQQGYGKVVCMPPKEWQKQLENVGPDNALYPFLPLYLGQDSQRLKSPDLICRIEHQHTDAAVKSLGMCYPKVDYQGILLSNANLV